MITYSHPGGGNTYELYTHAYYGGSKVNRPSMGRDKTTGLIHRRILRKNSYPRVGRHTHIILSTIRGAIYTAFPIRTIILKGRSIRGAIYTGAKDRGGAGYI